MGTSGDAIWPFASQPFMRSAGPLVPGQTEEWHLGLHAVLESVEPEKSIIWRIDNEGVDGTHGFTIVQDGKKTTVIHRVQAQLSDLDGRLLWKRIEDGHQRAIEDSSISWGASSSASSGQALFGLHGRGVEDRDLRVRLPGRNRRQVGIDVGEVARRQNFSENEGMLPPGLRT